METLKQEFTKEQLDAIKIVDKLYQLQEDNCKAHEYFRSKTNKTNLLCKLKNAEDIGGFRFVVPDLLCKLVNAIEKGDLVWKDA
jgi:hypothetical protein